MRDKEDKKEVQLFPRTEVIPHKKEESLTQSIPLQNIVSDDMRAMISKTLTAFRCE